ncbi:hypothetical protein B9G69_017095 [Bdellovibrio sp. SKB1291214]|uniref:hypothetical protein n=1 Tax=Bdellovibrio sp. SKB1291214 TaxID=1732569 RepID=UPI000B51B8AB|nr:hypothetical protein [Bdellovibrio sp. SKB1291214]UYL08761.1 hypothetical protein B9G69_017095 [Bdellovibrio sp. SKB1291214]
MKKLILLVVTAASLATFVGCSNNDSGGGGTVVPNCVNSTWNGQYCVNNNGTIVSPGVTTMRFYDYTYWFQVDYYTKMPVAVQPNARKSLQITNSSVYKKFLKEAMAVCDRNIWGGNYGYASCDAWTNGSLMFQLDMSNTMAPSIYFTAIPSQQYFSFSYGIDGGGMAYNPLALIQNVTYNLINSSKGFEIRSNGAATNAGGLHLIQIQVPTGSINDANITYQLAYPDSNGKGTVFATGVLTRY